MKKFRRNSFNNYSENNDFCCFPWDVITLCYTCQKERDVYYNRDWFPNKNLFIERRLCEKCNLSYEIHMRGCKYGPFNSLKTRYGPYDILCDW